MIYIGSSYRSNKNDAFKIYPRNRHRYKLGREILLETMLLSKCDIFLYSNSNVSKAVIGFNFNNNIKKDMRWIMVLIQKIFLFLNFFGI